MRLVLPRVSGAGGRVGGETRGAIGPGLLVRAGVREGDDEGTARRLAAKTAALRIFPDDEGRFNRSLLETNGEALIVSQFTLYADVRRGRRPRLPAAAPPGRPPSFSDAARPDLAEPLVEAYAAALEALGVRVARGRFGAKMEGELVNDGPGTLGLDHAA